MVSLSSRCASRCSIVDMADDFHYDNGNDYDYDDYDDEEAEPCDGEHGSDSDFCFDCAAQPNESTEKETRNTLLSDELDSIAFGPKPLRVRMDEVLSAALTRRLDEDDFDVFSYAVENDHPERLWQWAQCHSELVCDADDPACAKAERKLMRGLYMKIHEARQTNQLGFDDSAQDGDLSEYKRTVWDPTFVELLRAHQSDIDASNKAAAAAAKSARKNKNDKARKRAVVALAHDAKESSTKSAPPDGELCGEMEPRQTLSLNENNAKTIQLLLPSCATGELAVQCADNGYAPKSRLLSLAHSHLRAA